jgi:hypothetical protein
LQIPSSFFGFGPPNLRAPQQSEQKGARESMGAVQPAAWAAIEEPNTITVISSPANT